MIGIVMAGGKGTRMHLPQEKLLLHYKKPIILHVIDAMTNSNCFSKIIALTSPNSPKTRQILKDNNIETIETSGNGYVEDLNLVLQLLEEPVMIISGDLPLLDSNIIKEIAMHYNADKIWTSILVTKEFLNSNNLLSEYDVMFDEQLCSYTGISLVNTNKISDIEKICENFVIINNKKIAFNLNTQQDYDLLSTA